MSLSQKDGGLPPDHVVDDDDSILAASEEAVRRHHDPAWGAMTRVALAPCSPFSVTEELMVRTAELAERLDVRLHTHFAENAEDDEYSVAHFGCRPTEYLERTGWASDRTWVAHCVMPNADEIRRLGAAGVSAAHCPSSNLILASGIAPVVDLRAAGVAVGLGVDGSSSADSASLWLEARQAMLLAKLRNGASNGTARMALEIATLGGAACLGRTGELGVLEPGAVGDVAVWSLTGPAFAGALADPIEAWLRCGPVAARDTIVAGRPVVRDGQRGGRVAAGRDARRASPPRPPHPGLGLTRSRRLRRAQWVDMPSTRDRSSPRAVGAWSPAAAMLLLAGCGLDGSDPGVHALVSPTTPPGGQVGDPDAEMAPEQSTDGQRGGRWWSERRQRSLAPAAGVVAAARRAARRSARLRRRRRRLADRIGTAGDHGLSRRRSGSTS